MSTISRIQKNSVFYLISTISRLITNSLIFVVIARNYGPEQFGSFSSAYTFSMFFLILADFGFDLLVTTEIAKSPSDASKVFRKFFPIKVLFALFSFFLLFVAALLIPTSVMTFTLILILSFNMLSTTMLNLVYSVYRGIENFIHEAKISFFSNGALVLLVITASIIKSDIVIIAVMIIMIRVLALVFGLRKLKTNLSISLIPSFSLIRKKEIQIVFIFGLHLLFGTLYFQQDSILLMSIKGDIEAGIYQASMKLVLLVLVIPDIIIGVLLPAITRLYNENDGLWKSYSEFSFKFLIGLSLPISFIIFSFAEDIIKIIYNNNEYLATIPLLKLASFLIIIRFVAEPFAAMLTIRNRQVIRTIIVFAAALISLILNLYYIPLYSYNASIYISIFVNLFVAILYIIFNYNYFAQWGLKLIFLIPILIICTGYFLSKEVFISNSTIVIFLSVLFFLIFFYLFVFTKNEKKIINSFYHKLKEKIS